MKKLFKYEINESIAAKAAMNCVHKRLFKELYAFGAPMPQEEVTRGDYDPYEWEYDDYGNEEKRHLVHKALVQAGLIQSEEEGWQFNNKIQQLLDKTNFSVSNEQDAMKFVKAYGQQIVGDAQEQEEDYGMNDLRKWRDSLDFSNNDDDDADADEEAYTAYDDTDGVWKIINIMRGKGMLRAQGIEGRDDVDDGHAINKAYDLIEQKLNDEGMWIGEDDHEAERFVSFFGKEIAAEAMESALHNQEQEEMEVTDAKHALAEMVATQLRYPDGDLDEIYTIISDIIAEEGYSPEPDEYDEWVEEHASEIQDLVM